MIYDILWCAALVGGFLFLLVLPAAIIESKWGREWIARLDKIEAGRAHQRAEYLEKGCFFHKEP